MIEIDIVKIIIGVIINTPLIMSIILVIDYAIDGDYDIEIEIKDVSFKGENIYRKLWELVTGRKLNEVKEND